jgi:phage gp46-like protein
MDVMSRYRLEDTDGALFLSGDWIFVAPDLATDESLETAVLLSLFSDALAHEDDVLPDLHHNDRRGWWADTASPSPPFGSRLWLLAREKETEDVRLRAIHYSEEALAWMIADQVADRVEVIAEWSQATRGRLDLQVNIYRDGKLIFSKPYPIAWAATVPPIGGL